MSKLLFISILLCFAQVTVSQDISNITIEFKEQSLKSALCKLGEASRYQFIFQDEIPDTLVVTNQNFEDKALFQILDALFSASNFSFVVFGSRVIIYRLSEAIQSQETTPITVAGRVLGWEGRPAWGAGVYTKPNNNMLSSNNSHYIADESFVIATDSPNSYFVDVNCDDGAFVITVDNPNTYLIVIDGEHFPRVVHINDAELIQLELDKELLERIVIIGCGCLVVDE